MSDSDKGTCVIKMKLRKFWDPRTRVPSTRPGVSEQVASPVRRPWKPPGSCGDLPVRDK